MKPKTVVLLAVAVGSGLLAMIGVQQAMSGNQAAPVENVKVLVALTDIDIGVPFSEENVGFQELPRTSVTVNDPVMTEEQYKDRSPNFAITAGDLIRVSKLSEPGVSGKSQQIPSGMRVLTITVDDTGSFAGLLRPGDRVDVMVTYQNRDQRGRQQTKTTTLLEYVEVFATDDKTAREAKADADDAKNKTRTVGLLLMPENVPYVKLAESKGKLALSWRRRDDDELAQVGPINEELLDELKGLDAMGGAPGYAQFAPPLYGDGPEGNDFVQAAPSNDFGGIGSRTPAAAPTAGGPQNLDSMLTEAEAGAAAPAPVAAPVVKTAPALPPKPTWKLQIYNGNDAVAQEFELPEPELTEADAAELKQLHDTVQGNQLWSLLKQAL